MCLMSSVRAHDAAHVMHLHFHLHILPLPHITPCSYSCRGNAMLREYLEAKHAKARTPLHAAVDGGHLDIVRLLVEAGADVNSKEQ